MRLARSVMAAKQRPHQIFLAGVAVFLFGILEDGAVDASDLRVLGAVVITLATVYHGIRLAVQPMRDMASEFYEQGARDERRRWAKAGSVTPLNEHRKAASR